MILNRTPYADGYLFIDKSRMAKHGEYSLTITGKVKKVDTTKNILWEDGCYPIMAQSISLTFPDIPYMFDVIDTTVSHFTDKDIIDYAEWRHGSMYLKGKIDGKQVVRDAMSNNKNVGVELFNYYKSIKHILDAVNEDIEVDEISYQENGKSFSYVKK